MGPSEWNQAVAEYLRDCDRRGLRPATVRYYRMVLERLGMACALESPADLTLARVGAFQDDPGRLGSASLRGYLRATKTFARWLADEGRLEQDPLVRLRLPRVDTRVVEVPTDLELIAVLRMAGPGGDLRGPADHGGDGHRDRAVLRPVAELTVTVVPPRLVRWEAGRAPLPRRPVRSLPADNR